MFKAIFPFLECIVTSLAYDGDNFLTGYNITLPCVEENKYKYCNLSSLS